jgi:hypothetical protein
MAFCPHCGTGVTEQASACPACGQAVGTKLKGARFKGTMMTVGGQLQAAAPKPVTAPPTIAGPASKQPIAAAAAAPPPASHAVPTRNKGTMMGVGLPASDPTLPPASAPTAPAESPRPPRSPAPAPHPKSAAPPPDPLVRRPAANENRALPDLAASSSDGGPRRDGRFLAGSVPPPLATRSSSRWVAIGLGGMALIATAGYLVAQFLGLIH